METILENLRKQSAPWPCTDLDQRLHRLNLYIIDETERGKWGWPDAKECVAVARANIKNLKSGKWCLVRLTKDQYTLLSNVLAPHCEGRWTQIHPVHGVHFDLSQGDGRMSVDHLEFAPIELPRWREILDACKMLGYDAELCDGLYRRLERKALT